MIVVLSAIDNFTFPAPPLGNQRRSTRGHYERPGD